MPAVGVSDPQHLATYKYHIPYAKEHKEKIALDCG